MYVNNRQSLRGSAPSSASRPHRPAEPERATAAGQSTRAIDALFTATSAVCVIGGGSAGTAGGVKVTTFGVLAYAVWAELRGETHVNAGHRRIPDRVQRQALAITFLAVALIALSTYALRALTPHSTDQVLFEAVSAFATVGMSTGITADLTTAGQLVIALLMFVGRVGPVTLFSALALRTRTRRYELPHEQMIIG